MKTMADRIKHVRNTVLLLSQEELADQLGVSRGSVGNWELGGGIARKNLSALAVLAGCSMEWIESGRGQPPAEKTHAAQALISAKAQPSPTATEEHFDAVVQGMLAAFGVTGRHAVELEKLLEKVLAEPVTGRTGQDTAAARRTLAQFVTREFLRSNGLLGGGE